MNEIGCIFCGTESSNIVIEENGYKGRKCDQCGLIYVSPRPSFDEIVDLYGHDDAHVSAEAHLASDFAKRLYARHDLGIVRAFANGGTLLEIGAGAGYFLDEARKIGYAPHGLEFNPIQADFIRNQLGIPCEESPLSTEIFGGKKFDVVYHCDVISHLYDPISDFRIMNEVMNDDSFLIFETGNLGDVDQRYFKHFQKFQYPDHLFFFSTDNLVELLGKTGFSLEKIYRYSIVPELMARKVLSGVKDSINKHSAQPAENKKRSSTNGSFSNHGEPTTKAFGVKSAAKEGLRRMHKYFNYSLRYKLGRMVPKAHRPQTVVVVARKSSQVSYR